MKSKEYEDLDDKHLKLVYWMGDIEKDIKQKSEAFRDKILRLESQNKRLNQRINKLESRYSALKSKVGDKPIENGCKSIQEEENDSYYRRKYSGIDWTEKNTMSDLEYTRIQMSIGNLILKYMTKDYGYKIIDEIMDIIKRNLKIIET